MRSKPSHRPRKERDCTSRTRDYKRLGAGNRCCATHGLIRPDRGCRLEVRSPSKRTPKRHQHDARTMPSKSRTCRAPVGAKRSTACFRLPAKPAPDKAEDAFLLGTRGYSFYKATMKWALFRAGFTCALLSVAGLGVPTATAQDPSIDKLLSKLPPPEKLVKSPV